MNLRKLAIALTLALMPIAACHSTGSAGDPARSMARLPESTRAAADGYVSSVSDLGKQLAGVTDTASARAAMPSIEVAVTRISQATGQLSSTSPEARADINNAFGERIHNVNETYAAQVDRIKGTPGIGTTLGPLLDKVRIYR